MAQPYRPPSSSDQRQGWLDRILHPRRPQALICSPEYGAAQSAVHLPSSTSTRAQEPSPSGTPATQTAPEGRPLAGEEPAWAPGLSLLPSRRDLISIRPLPWLVLTSTSVALGALSTGTAHSIASRETVASVAPSGYAIAPSVDSPYGQLVTPPSQSPMPSIDVSPQRCHNVSVGAFVSPLHSSDSIPPMISSLPGTTNLPPAPVEGVQTSGVSLLPRNDDASSAPVSSPQSTPEMHALAGSTSEVAPSVTTSPEYEQSAQASSVSTTCEGSARAAPAESPYVPSASPPSVLPNTVSPAPEALEPSSGPTSISVQAHDAMTVDPLAALWQQAIVRYKDNTGVDLSSQSGTRFESQGSIVHYLDEQEKKFTKFRDRGCAARVCSALASIAPVLQPLCFLAGEGAGMVFAPSKVIFSAVGELVKAAVEADRELDSIVDAFDTIDHHLRILKSDAAHEILRDEALKEASVKLLAQILTILGVIQKVQREGRLVLWMKKLDNSKQVSSALDELGRLAANQHHTISAATLFTAKETMSILIECEASAKDDQAVARKYLAQITKIAQQIHDIVRRSTKTTQEQTSFNRGILENIQRVLLQQAHDMDGVKRDTTEIDKIFRWLQYPDSSVKMNTLLDDRVKSTGSWFLDGKDYTAFKRGEKRSIWLYGKAGCGKSTILAAAIRDLQAYAASSENTIVITHLFDTTNGSQPRNLRALLSSLLCQFAFSRHECAKMLVQLRAETSGGHAQLSLEAMQHHLDTIVQGLPARTFVVVDALDEAEDDRIISFLTHLLDHGNIHLFVSSRYEVSFCRDLEALCELHVPMNKLLVAKDIEVFLQGLLAEGGRLSKVADAERVREALSTGADGNFRWIILQVLQLAHVSGIPCEIWNCVNSLPRTLEEIYESALASIAPRSRRSVRVLLMWILFSVRPLSRDDFAKLLAFDYSERMPVYKASLLPSDTDSVITLVGSTLISASNWEVRLAHASVKDYLLALSPSSPFYIDKGLAYSLMARTGLAYISAISRYHHDHLTWTWVNYLLAAGQENYSELERDAACAIRECTTPEILYAALNTAVDMGHFSLMRLLLDRPDVSPDHPHGRHDGRTCDTHSSSPLARAVVGGHHNMVAVLLDHGAHINVFTVDKDLIALAVEKDPDIEMIRLLVHRRAVLPIPGGLEHAGILHIAAEGGRADIVRLLLDAGLYVNLRSRTWHIVSRGDRDNWTALHFAAASNASEVARLLIERHANVRARDIHFGQEPLNLACEYGNEEIARILVEAGADVNSCSTDGRTPLHNAAERGDTALVRFLIERHANVHACNRQGHQPLHKACFKGHKEVAQFLLDVGADIESTSSGWTPLLCAVNKGDRELVCLLIERHANIRGKAGGRTPLHLACELGHEEVARILVQAGVDVNESCTALGSTPLHFAAARGHIEVARFLIERHVDVHACDALQREPLHLACESGHREVACLLVDAGAIINSCSVDHRGGRITPLHLAAEHGDLELVRLFIDRHVDTRTRSGDGYEPLHFAAKGGHIAVCRLLLDHGAAVDARNYLGHTPLLLAAGGTDTPDILSLLISRGADVYARNNSDDSALQLAVLNDREKNMRMLLRAGFDRNVIGRMVSDSIDGSAANKGIRQLLLHGLSASDIEGEIARGMTRERNRRLARAAQEQWPRRGPYPAQKYELTPPKASFHELVRSLEYENLRL